MRRVVPALLLLLATSACNAVDAGPPCAAPEAYPVCTSARTAVLTCEDGAELTVPCGAGQTCLDLVDQASGTRLSECLPADSIGCDPAWFRSACLAPDTMLACVAPATYPHTGHTAQVLCAEGETCRLDGDRGVCLPDDEPPGPDPETCDPALYPGGCRDGAPLACVAGAIVAAAPCAAPTACQVGPFGALCVAAEAMVCDPALTPLVCDGAVVTGCDSTTGFTFRQECPEGQTCRPTPEGAVCSTVPTGGCDPLTYESHCPGETTRQFCTPFGDEVTETCPGNRVCRTGALGAVCVQPSAQACDPATFVPRCNAQFIVECDPRTAFTLQRPCGRMTRCQEQAAGAACL